MRLIKYKNMIICLIALTVAAISFSSCSAYNNAMTQPSEQIIEKLNTDIITQPDIAGLIKNSKHIISGKVLNVDPSVKVSIKFDYPNRITKTEREKLENSEDGYYMFTVSEVEVSKVINGDMKVGDIIKIYQLGGFSEEKKTVLDGVDYYKQGDFRIFFITDWDDKYTTVNPIQGDIKLVNKKSQINKENDLFRDGISEDELINSIVDDIEKNKNSTN